ncbi:type II secretion system F family protein [Candidatus Woesebacteria bacterium]|nr:type II secretion system F family protein [Candidatus Woesebacteria bacterium]QQG47940.1 MAG: type II secretion system F family protein [Candidatus Woesebacteria bacterium]
MPIFSYKAQDQKGKIVEDTIQASGRDDALSALKGAHLQVLTLKGIDTGGIVIGGRGSVSVEEKAVFCRFMATMLRAGLSIPEAIEILRAETKKPKMKKILSDLSFQTQKGKNLTSVLSEYKEDFDPVFLTMVRVGEESGTLEKSFEYLAKQLAASHDLNQKIKGSLMYPAIIVVAMIGNGVVMTFFVLPKIATAFLKLDVSLPLPTKIVLNFGAFVGSHILMSAIAMLVASALTFLFFYLKPTRNLVFKVIKRFPVLKKIINQIDIARFARTLSTLLKSGVLITDALDVTADALTNPDFKREVKGFSLGIEKGESLSKVLSKVGDLFPPVMLQTIRAGEKTGTLDQTLDEMAVFYESEVDYALKRATSLLEPLLMLFIGIVVGVMVIIMIAPIYGVIGSLQQQVGNQGR